MISKYLHNEQLGSSKHLTYCSDLNSFSVSVITNPFRCLFTPGNNITLLTNSKAIFRFSIFRFRHIPKIWVDIHNFHPNAPLPPRGTKAGWLHPNKSSIHAWNGLDAVTPRLVDSRPPQALRICTGLGKPFPPSCTLFLSAAGLGALLPRTVRLRVRHTKEKPPMALVGLTLGVGQSWNQYA